MYKNVISGNGVIRISDNMLITEESKKEWDKYIKWKEDGGVPDPAETTSEKKNRLTAELRTKRDALLSESDIMMFADHKEGGDRPALRTYRQKLKDMPQTHTNVAQLENQTWPDLSKP